MKKLVIIFCIEMFILQYLLIYVDASKRSTVIGDAELLLDKENLKSINDWVDDITYQLKLDKHFWIIKDNTFVNEGDVCTFTLSNEDLFYDLIITYHKDTKSIEYIKGGYLKINK